jgi:hypothetical protein
VEPAGHDAEEPLSSISNSNTPTTAGPASTATENPQTTQVDSPTSHAKRPPPCKLLTRLAENPATDITQISAPSSSVDPPQAAAGHGGDVECGKAYEMLIRYATSEEKMDDIARALENGCKANGKGGCAIKSKVLLQTLDGMCG